MVKKTGRLVRLESLRGFAAVLVLLGHVDSTHVLRPLSGFGQEAVILFFLLSGFVIHYSSFGKAGADTDYSRRPSFARYFIHRFRRIYPLMILSLIAAYVGHCMVAKHWLAMPWRTLGGHLLMLQDVATKSGYWFAPFCGNDVLWSLSYEWWFYMLFFPLVTLLWARSAIQKYLAVGISAVGFVVFRLHPNEPCLILTYLPIWWSGVELSREYCTTGNVSWRRQWPNLVFLLTLAALWSVPVVAVWHRHQHVSLGLEPFLELRHFVTAAAILSVGIAWRQCRFLGFNQLLGVFSLLAPITYAVYIFHLPAFVIAEALFPALHPEPRAAVAIVLLLPICYLLEVRLQRHINRWLDLPARSKAAPPSAQVRAEIPA